MDRISPNALFFEPPIFVQTDTLVISPSPNLITVCNKNNLQIAASIWQQLGACPVAPSSDASRCLAHARRETPHASAAYPKRSTVHYAIKI